MNTFLEFITAITGDRAWENTVKLEGQLAKETSEKKWRLVLIGGVMRWEEIKANNLDISPSEIRPFN